MTNWYLPVISVIAALMSISTALLLFFQFSQPARRLFDRFGFPPVWSVFRKPVNGPGNWRSRLTTSLSVHAMLISQCLAFLFFLLATTWHQFTAVGAATAIRVIGSGTVTTQIGLAVIVTSWIILVVSFLLLLFLRGLIRISKAYILSLERQDRPGHMGEDGERDYQLDSLTSLERQDRPRLIGEDDERDYQLG
jgi:hypothetical protein